MVPTMRVTLYSHVQMKISFNSQGSLKDWLGEGLEWVAHSTKISELFHIGIGAPSTVQTVHYFEYPPKYAEATPTTHPVCSKSVGTRRAATMFELYSNIRQEGSHPSELCWCGAAPFISQSREA